jgi:Fe-S cluster assembly protein SufD
VSEIFLDENAIVDHYKLQNESIKANHISVQQVYQDSNSNFTSHVFTFGGSLVRNDVNVILDGEGIDSTINSIYMLAGDQHVDNHTFIDHARPHCNSRENYKGILNDQSRAVFNGKIYVRQDAQKTDAIQFNRNLLLTDSALVNTQPQLEIFADDVRCTHGGTVGQMDEDALFYLKARGIGETNARKITVQAFAGEIIENIKVDVVREKVIRLVNDRLDI